MAKLSKRVKEMKAKVDRNKVYAFDNAVSIVKEFATAKFNESIDVAIQLGVDPKKSDQVVRGSSGPRFGRPASRHRQDRARRRVRLGRQGRSR